MSTTSLAAVTVIGNDRPGIVSAITRVLFELGCNLQDATSTILSGHFAMMLIVGLPAGVDPARIEAELEGVGTELDLVIAARPVHEAQLDFDEPTHLISVYGGDRPGIVYRVTDHLSDSGINVTDLSSRVIGSAESPVYALMLEVATPAGSDLEAGLAGLKESLGVDITVNAIEPDIL